LLLNNILYWLIFIDITKDLIHFMFILNIMIIIVIIMRGRWVRTTRILHDNDENTIHIFYLIYYVLYIDYCEEGTL